MAAWRCCRPARLASKALGGTQVALEGQRASDWPLAKHGRPGQGSTDSELPGQLLLPAGACMLGAALPAQSLGYRRGPGTGPLLAT
jgi:hypothetical protein